MTRVIKTTTTGRGLKKLLLVALMILSSMTGKAQFNTNSLPMVGQSPLYYEDYVLSIQYFNQVISANPYF